MLGIALLLATSSTVAPQTPARNPDPPVSPAKVDLHGKEVRIPFRTDGSRPIPVVEARVNGQGPYRFYFDTGASGCVVDSGFAREAGLESRGKVPVGDPSGKSNLEADAVRIAKLTLQGAEWLDVPAVAFDRSRFGAEEGIVGVLGLPLAEKHLLSIDYGAGELRLSEESLPESGAGIVQLFGDGPLPEVEIVVAGKPIRAHLDTGSPSGFTLPASFAADVPWKSEPVVIGRGGTVANEFEIKEGELDGVLVFAGRTFEAPRIRIRPLFPTATIGRAVLGEFVFAIDQRNRRARFLPAKAAATEANASPAKRRLGVRFGSSSEPLTVEGVDAGSAAETAGLRAGDELVSVNGRRIGASDLSPLQDAVRGEAAISIVVRREGREQTFVIPAVASPAKKG